MPTETLTLINNPGSYDLGTVNYTTKVVKAINDQFTDPACSGTIEFRLEYCDIVTVPANIPVGTGILYGSTVNLTTWFSTGVNTSIEYDKTINGVTSVITTPTSFTFNQPENTDVTITLRDTQLVSPECKASVTKTVLNQPKACKKYTYFTLAGTYGTPETLSYSYIPCKGGLGTEADRVTVSHSTSGEDANTDVYIQTECMIEGSIILISTNWSLASGTGGSESCTT